MIKLKSLFRRGQPPSNSKYGPGHQQQQQSQQPVGQLPDSAPHLKGSSSTSNIDGLGLSKADKKKQKEFGSRDHLDRKEHKSSKDRLVDNFRGKPKSKKQQQQQQPVKQEFSAAEPMSLVSQQQQQQQQPTSSLSSVVGLPPNVAAYEHQRPVLSTYAIVDEHLAKELTEINFDGPHGDKSKSSQLHELRLQLDRVTAEKRAVEAQLAEMSAFQTEVVALRHEMAKMKVKVGFCERVKAEKLICSLTPSFQMSHETYAYEVQRLADENDSLRSHLRDVVHSPLSDAEKQKIIDDSQRLHNSAPASFAIPSVSSIGTALFCSCILVHIHLYP